MLCVQCGMLRWDTSTCRFRQAVGFCDEALFDEPGNVKAHRHVVHRFALRRSTGHHKMYIHGAQALYRKADALGELCDWHEAEEARLRFWSNYL